MEELLKADILRERGFVCRPLGQQPGELDEHEGRVALAQAVASFEQPQELLRLGGLLNELVHFLALWGGSEHLSLLHVL